MKDVDNELKLYSISAAAKLMSIGRDTLKSLIAQGEIGYLQIGKRKKISYAELVRYQLETTKNNKSTAGTIQLRRNEINNFFSTQKHLAPTVQPGAEILYNIIRRDNGNSKNKI